MLQALAAVLPSGCTPILITDAGFRRPWLQAVQAQGWYYVGRVRNRDLYRVGTLPWAPVTNLYAQATASPKPLGTVEMTRNQPFVTRLYGVKQPAQGRQHWRISGRVARGAR